MQNSDVLLRSATPVQDEDCRRLKESLCLEEYVSSFEAKLDVSTYYNTFLNWIRTSTQVQFSPPEKYHARMCSGTTEAFNDFYVRHHARELFIFRGEYPYHKDVFESLKRPLFYLDETPLHKNAFVILSLPFSATGSEHPRTLEILKICSDLEIPVLIDFAFLGLGAKIDAAQYFQFSCIDTFTYSYSKMFAMGRMRAGWMWTTSLGGPLDVINKWKYTNWLSHYVALSCLRHFAFDHMSVKYAPLQQKVCSQLGLTPSETYLFGLGGDAFNAFHRQQTVNRLCISKLLDMESRSLTQRTLDSSL